MKNIARLLFNNSISYTFTNLFLWVIRMEYSIQLKLLRALFMQHIDKHVQPYHFIQIRLIWALMITSLLLSTTYLFLWIIRMEYAIQLELLCALFM